MSPDTVAFYVLVDLAVILAAAWALGTVCLWVGQPRVVGEILAGILLGPTFVGDASDDLFPPEARDVLSAVGQVGLAVFMFLVGLTVDWARMSGRVKGAAAGAVGAVVVPVVAAFAVAPLFWSSEFVPHFGTDAAPARVGFGLMLAAMLSVTALPVAVRIMQEHALESTDVGVVTIAAAAVATVIMFLLVGTAGDVATNEGPTPIVLRLVWTVLFIGVLLLVVRPALGWLATVWDTHQALICGLSLMFVSAALANRIGINVIVGAFLAGAVMPDRERLSLAFDERLGWLTTTLLLPVFLAYSGLNTDLGVLTADAALMILVLTLLAVLSRVIGAVAGGRAGGLTPHEAWTVAAVLNCRGLLVLVVGLAAVDAGVFTPQLHVGSVVVALVTTAMTGPLVARTIRGAPDQRVASV